MFEQIDEKVQCSSQDQRHPYLRTHRLLLLDREFSITLYKAHACLSACPAAVRGGANALQRLYHVSDGKGRFCSHHDPRRLVTQGSVHLPAKLLKPQGVIANRVNTEQILLMKLSMMDVNTDDVSLKTRT